MLADPGQLRRTLRADRRSPGPGQRPSRPRARLPLAHAADLHRAHRPARDTSRTRAGPGRRSRSAPTTRASPSDPGGTCRTARPCSSPGRTSRRSSSTQAARLPDLATISGPAERSSASECCAGREPRPCPTATSRLPAARCPASRPGQPGESKTGGSTASGWPPSPPRRRRESPSSTPGTTPPGALKERAIARTGHRMAYEPILICVPAGVWPGVRRGPLNGRARR